MNNERPDDHADSEDAPDPREAARSAHDDNPCPNEVRPEKVASARRSLQAKRYDEDGVMDATVERLYAAIMPPRKDLP